MPENNLNRFFLSIVLPSMLAIAFFIILIFMVILPGFERNIMEGKKETISELTNTAWSLIDEYYSEVKNGKLNVDSAKILAAKRIEKIRYGDEYKDYFWIIDKQPRMIMHPYRSELINTDLSRYKDPKGNLLFVEATRVVEKDGEGYINYMWQWKDDSSRIVPKLSFVKGFEAWDWIIGTGIYLEDVRIEINSLKNKLLKGMLLFTILIITVLGFIIRQSLKIEKQRKSAEERLRISRQKYKALVEASTEGTMMILKDEIIFANIKFSKLSGYDPINLRSLNFEALFKLDWSLLLRMFKDPKQSISQETELKCSDGTSKEVVVSLSKINFENEIGYIIIIKEISPERRLEKDSELLSSDLQNTLLLLEQPVSSFAKKGISCADGVSIQDAVALMRQNNTNILFVIGNNGFVGLAILEDLIQRTDQVGMNNNEPVSGLARKDFKIVSDNVPVYEAILALDAKEIFFLITLGNDGNPKGIFGKDQILGLFKNTFSFLQKEIAAAKNVVELKKIYGRLPVLVKALLESGSKTSNINKIITGVADAIFLQIIHLALKEYGPSPCEFAFIVMGSEGRGEQTLATDQDNAIIYKDSGEEMDKEAKKYFLALGNFVSNKLHEVGYEYCKGKIMASNPQWNQPLQSWKDYFSKWINEGSPQDILEAEIFFDFRRIYGEPSLLTELHDHVEATCRNKSVFFYNMADSILKFKPPLNIFGNIVGTESQKEDFMLNFKKALLPVLTFIRLYSLKESIKETNSLERLKKLAELNIIDDSSYYEIVFAYDTMMRIRLQTQIHAIWQNETPTNMVDIKRLTKFELSNLKNGLAQIGNLQTKISFDFKAGA